MLLRYSTEVHTDSHRQLLVELDFVLTAVAFTMGRRILHTCSTSNGVNPGPQYEMLIPDDRMGSVVDCTYNDKMNDEQEHAKIFFT